MSNDRKPPLNLHVVQAEAEGEARGGDVHTRLLSSARRGMDNPHSLTAKETQDICYALVVHYAQMGIG